MFIFHNIVDDHVTGMLRRPGGPASLADCLRRDVADVDRNLALPNAARRNYEAHFPPEAGLAALVASHEGAVAGARCWESL